MKPLQQEVRDAEERLRVAMMTNDVAALTGVLHDDIVFTGPDGAIVRKQDDLAAHAARRLRLTRLDHEDAKIDIDDFVAKVTVRAILAGTFDGNVCDGNYRYTRTWRKDGGRWRCKRRVGRAVSSALGFTVFVALFSLFGCSSGPFRSEGTLCSSDAECGAGLSCVGFGAFSDAGCTTMVKACSKQCALDSDCVALGATYKCFLACDGTRSCGAT